MKNGIFWEAFKETGKVADYLRYKYEGENDFCLNFQRESMYQAETSQTSEEQKWEMQLQ